MGNVHNELDELELEVMLEAIFRRYGYDFREYAKASLLRRLHLAREALNEPDFGQLQYRIIRDENAFRRLLSFMSVTVTEMFRDPLFFAALREHIFPHLSTYPFLKVWHAGCATGEEVYSMAIFFKEAGLYERTHFYATDINSESLKKASRGIYPVAHMAQSIKNYQQAGGREDFSQYYSANYESIKFHDSIKSNITFSSHNLATDGVFNEMDLIICRNVMIYFGKALQERVLNTFYNSLSPLGFLALGSKETAHIGGNELFMDCVRDEKIYRKRGS
ncbi:CheR family methyltransferase [Balneatrix alpica]|uniref:CheR family methyltransferase n=1 Tax=Balneatrix alpica TaxID=75684 RepID=UPI0027397F3A|nr:protein-glutamate O-methyltransferase CheR [Balneatrix alpica]